jgi:hypothetical protein
MRTDREKELSSIIVEGERILVKAYFNGHKHSGGDEYQDIRDKVEIARCELFNENPLYCKPQYRKKKGTN